MMSDAAEETAFPSSKAITMAEAEARSETNKTVLIASIVTAAVVSAVTAGYIVWRKSQSQQKPSEDVQLLLDKAHKTLHVLEDRLEDLRSTAARGKSGTATA